MAEIRGRSGPSSSQQAGKLLQAASPLLAAIPVAGPALSVAAGAVGGAMANKSAVAGIESGASKLGKISAPSPTTSAPATPAPDSGPAMQRKLEEAQAAAQTMPNSIRAAAEPVLDQAQDALRRRDLRGALYGNN